MPDNDIPQKSPYWAALSAALEEFKKLQEQERETAFRKAKLKATINALHPLVFPDSPMEINTLSLPNAIRLAIRGATRPLSTYELKAKLEDLGFDFSKYENPLANLHTAVNRMVESEEMIWVHSEEQQKKDLPGPELNSVPQTEPPKTT